MNTNQIIDEAVCLPVEQRALVLGSLLKSFNKTESDIDNKLLVMRFLIKYGTDLKNKLSFLPLYKY